MPLERRKELLMCCLKNNIPVIEDDTLYDLWLDEGASASFEVFGWEQ